MRLRCGNALAISFLAAACSAFLLSCGGAGNDGRVAAPLVLAYESPAGIYYGTFRSTSVAHPVAYQTVGLISENHDVQFFLSSHAQRHYAGYVLVFGSEISGLLFEYRGVYGRFFGIDGVNETTFDGSVAEADNIFADYSGQSDEGQINLDYSTRYEDDSSLARTTGIWMYSEASSGGAVHTITLDIDANGQIFGADSTGCIYSGQLSIIDANYNAYRAHVIVANCGVLNGDYNGLASVSALGIGQMDRLTLGVSNDVIAFASVFDKT